MFDIFRALMYPFGANLESSEKIGYGIALVIVICVVVALFGSLAFLFV